jgi:hypothetical protein
MYWGFIHGNSNCESFCYLHCSGWLNLNKKFPAFYTTQIFITVSQVPTTFAPHFFKIPLVITTHIQLSIPSGFFPSDFLFKMNAFFFSSMHALYPIYLIHLHFFPSDFLFKLMHFSSPPCMLPVSSTSSSIWSSRGQIWEYAKLYFHVPNMPSIKNHATA